MFEHVILQDEQKQLLIALVEAARNIPRDKRSQFMFINTGTESWVQHWGIPNWNLDCYQGDVEVLAQRGFLNPSYGTSGISGFDIAPEGFLYYQELMQTRGKPVQQVPQATREYLKSDQFQRRHSQAFQKWLSAEELVWQTDTDQKLSTVGHLCREAVQEFAASLIAEFKIADAPNQKAQTIARLKAVIESQSAKMPTTLLPFLDALMNYWERLISLIQRQEHGGQREKEPLVWEDGRRVVFHTLIVMYEVDRVLSFCRDKSNAANSS